MNEKNEAGFTLLEIIVAVVLVTLVGASVLKTFVNASRFVSPSAPELVAVYDARGRLDQLHEEVRNDTWNLASNALSVGAHTDTPDPIDGRTYTRNYVVSSVSLDGANEAYRKVVVTESWTS